MKHANLQSASTLGKNYLLACIAPPEMESLNLGRV